MAKKNAAAAPAANTANNGENRSELIRQYKAAHPNAGPTEIAKALSENGHDVKASLVSSVLGGKHKKGGLNVETIKIAAAFVKAHKGKVAEAQAAIREVGDFIDACGGSGEALAAIEAYQAVAAAVA